MYRRWLSFLRVLIRPCTIRCDLSKARRLLRTIYTVKLRVKVTSLLKPSDTTFI